MGGRRASLQHAVGGSMVHGDAVAAPAPVADVSNTGAAGYKGTWVAEVSLVCSMGTLLRHHNRLKRIEVCMAGALCSTPACAPRLTRTRVFDALPQDDILAAKYTYLRAKASAMVASDGAVSSDHPACQAAAARVVALQQHLRMAQVEHSHLRRESGRFGMGQAFVVFNEEASATRCRADYSSWQANPCGYEGDR